MLELQQKENKKNALGQFFTKQNVWLKPQVLDFIKYTKTHIAYDPFAGDGDLLKVARNLGYKKIIGLDIDPTLEKKWIINDSLVYIPKIDDAIIITNPPFLHKSSAKRKGIRQQVLKYFDNSAYIDLYLIALDKALKAVKYVVAIVPETFINSNFEHMNRLTSITVLEENPFEDTEVPVCVVTFDDKEKDFSKVKVFKNDRFVNDFYT